MQSPAVFAVIIAHFCFKCGCISVFQMPSSCTGVEHVRDHIDISDSATSALHSVKY